MRRARCSPGRARGGALPGKRYDRGDERGRIVGHPGCAQKALQADHGTRPQKRRNLIEHGGRLRQGVEEQPLLHPPQEAASTSVGRAASRLRRARMSPSASRKPSSPAVEATRGAPRRRKAIAIVVVVLEVMGRLAARAPRRPAPARRRAALPRQARRVRTFPRREPPPSG